jgi:hypothetical protein
MDSRVTWRPEALNAAAGYMVDDPVGIAQVFNTVDTLPNAPRPTEAFPMGKDRYRLRIGRYRLVYELQPAGAVLIDIIHLGRRNTTP